MNLIGNVIEFKKKIKHSNSSGVFLNYIYLVFKIYLSILLKKKNTSILTFIWTDSSNILCAV